MASKKPKPKTGIASQRTTPYGTYGRLRSAAKRPPTPPYGRLASAVKSGRLPPEPKKQQTPPYGRLASAAKRRKTGPRITAQQAAQAAAAYLHSLVTNVVNLTVEETELSEDDRFWLITLGFQAVLPFGPKEYKVIKVDVHTADVLSMRIRQG